MSVYTGVGPMAGEDATMRTLPRSGLALIALLAVSAPCAAAPVPPAAPPKPLPAEIVAAWVEAGAEVGWMTVGEMGYSQFRIGETGQVGEIPAFRFPKWRSHGRLRGMKGGGDFERSFGDQRLELPADLPDPGQWFGLDHTDCRLPDGWLMELGRFKHLYVLNLNVRWGAGSSVTDTGLTQIGRLFQLRVLRIDTASITDTGLLRLAGLSHLRVLEIPNHALTDDG